MMKGVRIAAALAVLSIGLVVACTDEGEQLPTSDIVATIPWPAQEEAVYRLLEDGEPIGTGVLRIQEEGQTLRLTLDFKFPDRGFTDTVEAVVDAETLEPQTIERVIVGPEGERRWEVTYTSSLAIVSQTAGDDERTDRLGIPQHAYDGWSDLILWRTIDFREGYEASYTDVLTAILDKPQRQVVTLRVQEKGEVVVPAGTFEAWKLEFQSGGSTQTAWYATTDTRPLILYDNGSLVFELEELR